MQTSPPKQNGRYGKMVGRMPTDKHEQYAVPAETRV